MASKDDRKSFGKEVSAELMEGNDRSLSQIAEDAGTQILHKDARAELDKFLPNDFLFDVHKMQLGARVLKKMKFEYYYTNAEVIEIVAQSGGKVINIKPAPRTLNKVVYCTFPDRDTLDKSLDKIYKLKGLYAPEKTLVPVGKFSGQSDRELDAAIAEEEETPEMKRFRKFQEKDVIEG